MPQLNKEKRKEYNKQYYLKNKCTHGRQKHRCIECGGASICEHHRIKSTCKECGGRSICDHNRQKSQCKEYGGASICDHNRIKSTCKECGGASICDHNRIKSTCKECGGSSICPHDRRKSLCIDCNPILHSIHLQRCSIYRIMKETNLEKTKPSIEYLGCSAEYFRDFIKSKMTDEMTFDNIHYDHIKPVSVFNLEDENELLDCCHYTNYQPLLAKDNLSKYCKWNEEDEAFWNEHIKGKEYLPLYFPKG